MPHENYVEATAVSNPCVLPAATLREAVRLLNGDVPAALAPVRTALPSGADDKRDLADVHGQAHTKRALEIAATGGHNALLCGRDRAEVVSARHP